jgi:hypothetical protein
MKLNSVWTALVYFFDVLTFQTTNINEQPSLQAPLDPIGNDASGRPVHPHVKPAEVKVMNWEDAVDDGKAYSLEDGTPIIPISKNGQEGPKGLACKYPKMTGYKSCHGPNSRNCWLVKKDRYENKVIDIGTDYEDPDEIPVGITRQVGEDPQPPSDLEPSNTLVVLLRGRRRAIISR